MMWNYGFGWGFPFFPLVGILFWVFIISLFWRHGHHLHDHTQKDKSAEEILDERFAKGEINEEEYSKRLTVLRKHSK